MSQRRLLSMVPGSYRYRLIQRAEINDQAAIDTVPASTVTTVALLYVDVSRGVDSTFSAVVSIDSLKITSEGRIPSLRVISQVKIDSVLRTTLSLRGASTQTYLPDSLCAYSHLVSLARSIILPELPAVAESPPPRIYADTVRETSCRGGIRLETVTIRELRDTGSDPFEATFQQRSTTEGAGLVRQDSLVIAGSARAQGIATFTQGQRLPSVVRTTSDALITIRLGAATTTFRQVTHQDIELLRP